MNLIKKYKTIPIQLKSTIWFVFCNILQKGMLFLAIPIYTRLMTTVQYGSYSVFLSWLELFEIIATFRLGWGGYIVGLNKYSEDRDRYTSSMQSLSITITTVCLFLYLAFHSFVNNVTGLSTTVTLMIFGILYFMPAIQFWTVRARVEYRYKSVLLVTIISSCMLLSAGICAALLFEEKDVAVIASRLLIQGIIGMVLIYINCKNHFVLFHKEYWKRALLFNGPLLPYYFSMVVLHSTDKIIIEDLVGTAEAGIYGVAYTISMCMQLFSTSINQTLQPWLYDKMKENNLERVPTIINFTLIIIAGLNLVAIALAPEIMTIAAPASYREAIWIMPPLAASVVVMYFYQHFVNVEFYFEESKYTAIASIGAAICNVALNYLLIPRFGYFAAGYTTLISYLMFALVHYIFMKIICKKHGWAGKVIDIVGMVVILAVFGMVSVILMIGYKYSIIRYLSILLLCIIVVLKKNAIMNMIGELVKRKKSE